MVDYEYTRELVNGVYNIDNPLRVDGEGKQIYLANEVQTAIPGKNFKLVCNGTNATFIFEVALTTEEQTTLGNTVTAHKNNT